MARNVSAGEQAPSTAIPALQWWAAPERDTAAAHTREAFEAQFGAAPDGVWSAPGRVNLIGEHTDYAGGMSFPAALPHRTYVAIRRRQDNQVNLFSAQMPPEAASWQAELAGAGAEPPKLTGWGAYVAGVAWAMQQVTGGPADHHLGFDALITSAVPVGASLSSSAALEAAVAVALSDLWGFSLTETKAGRQQLAAICQRAENDVVGVPSGGLDQIAALLSAPGHAVIADFSEEPPLAEPVPLDLAGAGLALLVIDSRVPHQLSDAHYAARRTAAERAAALLGHKSLRDVDLETLDAAIAELRPHDADQKLHRRARHVVTETARAAAFINLVRHGLGAGGLPNTEVAALAGALLDASHMSLRDDHEVTVRETDLAAATARASGAYGARMTGGGFGGAVIALVNEREAPAIAEAVAAGFASVGLTAPAFLIATPSAAAERDI